MEDGLLIYKDDLFSIDAKLWLKTIESEMNSIIKNKIWILKELPPENKSIGCKKILKKNKFRWHSN